MDPTLLLLFAWAFFLAGLASIVAGAVLEDDRTGWVGMACLTSSILLAVLSVAGR